MQYSKNEERIKKFPHNTRNINDQKINKWDQKTIHIHKKRPFRWLSVKQATVNLIRGLSTGVSLLPSLLPGQEQPLGYQVGGECHGKTLLASGKSMTTLNTGRVGRNQHVMDLFFTTEKPKKPQRHQGVCFPSKVLVSFAWMSCSSPSPKLSGATTMPACLFVVNQCGLIVLSEKD